MSSACLAPPHHLVLQVLLRHRQQTSQLEFAQSAARIVTGSESYLACVVGAGLLLYGINEQALSRPLADLHERYDGGLDQIGPYARHIEEGGVLEPLMHVRVRVQLEHMDAVRRELLMRAARAGSDGSSGWIPGCAASHCRRYGRAPHCAGLL
jgi:hypothetical protein